MGNVTYTTPSVPPMRLAASTLAQLPISGPSYARDKVQIGIVHFGVGGFHRAHQAMYVDQLLERGWPTNGASAVWACCPRTVAWPT